MIYLELIYQQTLVIWGMVGGLIYIGCAVWAALHALLTKDNIRAATGWIGLIWFAPLVGMILYYIFGINRIRRRARARRKNRDHLSEPEFDRDITPKTLGGELPEELTKFRGLARLNGEITGLPIVRGNSIEPLYNGNQTYRAMLTAIRNAEVSISLCSYIFRASGVGEQFVEALAQARERGVKVRVLIDDVGARHASPSAAKPLQKCNVTVQKFMKTLVPWKFRYSNLRNHRKILVVDGKIGFTGGMNIADEYYHAEGEGTPATGQDTHFRLEGPIVSELQYVFAEDWIFSSGEELQGPEWFPEMEPRGTVPARGIADGPDENYDAIRFALLGAIATADQKIDICTPYFLPDDELLSALYVAVMRGIEVNLLVPVRTNSRLVQWASRPGLKKLVEAGCNVYLTRSPFNHSKLMVVDEIWSFIGSANWDARSLKLNFEFNVELYDREFARKLSSKINEWKQDSDQARVRDFTGNLATNLRDRAVRLFSPYL